MEIVLSVLAGMLVAGAVFMMLNRNLVNFLFGLVLLSNAANLVLLIAGRLTINSPAFIESGALTPPLDAANSLPQALILTAIVISFGLLSFALVMAYRAYQEIGSIDMDELGGRQAVYNEEQEQPQAGENT